MKRTKNEEVQRLQESNKGILNYPYWASVASPTLGCSIEISYIYVGMSVVCQINCVGGIMWPTRMLKVIFGR